jgi:hypothetical protein
MRVLDSNEELLMERTQTVSMEADDEQEVEFSLNVPENASDVTVRASAVMQ